MLNLESPTQSNPGILDKIQIGLFLNAWFLVMSLTNEYCQLHEQ